MRQIAIFFLLTFLLSCQNQETAQNRSPSDQKTKKEIKLPEYEVVDVVDQIVGGKSGEILIPSYNPDMDADSLSKVAFAIIQKEELNEASFYKNESARKSNLSVSYREKHPNALEEGYLGAIREGKFTPSSY